MVPNQIEIKKKLVEELQNSPVVQCACSKLHVPRANYYRWIKNDKKFRKKVNEAMRISTPIVNDLAESTIINKIKDKDLKASIFWLLNNHPKYRKNNLKALGIKKVEIERKYEERLEAEKDRKDIKELLELATKLTATKNHIELENTAQSLKEDVSF